MKKLLSVGVAAVMSLALAGCNMGAAGGTGATKENPVTIKVGDNWGATHPTAAVVDKVFKTEVESKTNGAVKVDVYHSGTLGNEADLFDGVRNGTIEMVVVGSSMNQEFPTMLISDWPFLYRDVEHAKKVWTGPVAQDVNKKFEEKFPTVKVLGWAPNSARTFTSKKPLTKVEDFAGQKFRMPNNPIHIGLAQNLGASSQVIPLGELFSSLETGVVDGQDNGMVTVVSEGLYEVQKYVYETNHIVATLEFLMNDSTLKKLSPEQQQVIKDAASKASVQAWDDYIASIDKDREFLRSKGLTVTELTPEEREKMLAKIKPVTDKLLQDNAWAPELTEKIRAVK